MSSSLPVPSKAALTALRGLVVGTSCTLALIAEDRRRKINNAVRVIENGQKIKSARRYHPGSGALALAMEEEALWEPGLFSIAPANPPQQRDGLPQSTQTRKQKQTGRTGHPGQKHVGAINGESIESVTQAAEAGSTRQDEGVPSKREAGNLERKPDASARKGRSAEKPEPFVPRLSTPQFTPLQAGPSWLRANVDVLKAYEFPNNDEIVARVRKACDSRDPRQIGTALRFVLEAMDSNIAPDNLNRPWIEATALLCRTCQETGRIDDAVKLLDKVLSRGPLDEDDYFSHHPIAVIEALLARADGSDPAGSVYKSNLGTATNLFLAGTFTERPSGLNQQVYELGRRLLEMSFTTDRLHRVIGLYRRCNLVAGEHSESLTSWFLTKLHEKHDYKSVVKIFLSTFTKISPTEACLRALGGVVVHSVESAHGYRSEEVLKTLCSMRASLGKAKLESQWAMKLLVSHWTQHRDFEKIESLFDLLRTPSLKKTVFRPDGVYRVMVELALEAGEDAKAESYFLEAAAQSRDRAPDARLLGVLARSYAQNGDWEAVRTAFEAMDWGSKPNAKAYGQVFVPVLKAYIQGHTIHETETFVKSYIEELKVPLCSYTVTLMAKQYAAVRDVRSLIDWLNYCSQQGFSVDAAFSNAILVSCRRVWNFPFRELRTLFRKLRVLNPDFVDKHTGRVMADAALSDSKYGGKAARGRLLSLRMDSDTLPLKSRYAQTHDVLLAMKEALTWRRPDNAVRIYKRALHNGMPFSQDALRLAVQARLKSSPHGYSGALDLLRDAQKRGHDINPTVNYVLSMQLSDITASQATTDQTLAAVQATLAHFERCGIRLTDTSLHRAALTCLGAGHPGGAVGYALKAAEARGLAPCYSLANFRILLSAYAELVDLGGLRNTVRAALAARYREQTACLRALKHARLRIARAGRATDLERRQARALVDAGIGEVVQARRRLREDGKVLEREALEIMRRAAADAGREPVDFESVPWLGGGKAKGAAAAAGGGGGGGGSGSGSVGDGEEEVDDLGYYDGGIQDVDRCLDLDGGRGRGAAMTAASATVPAVEAF